MEGGSAKQDMPADSELVDDEEKELKLIKTTVLNSTFFVESRYEIIDPGNAKPNLGITTYSWIRSIWNCSCCKG